MNSFQFLKFQRTILASPFIAIILLWTLSVSSAYGADTGRTLIGQWKVVAALDGAEITSRNEDEAQQLVGHVISISKKTILIGGEDCLPPSFEATSVEPNLYVREQAHASASLLKLPNPVTVVDLGCTIAFIKNRNRIVIFWDGWFFEAIRVKSHAQVLHPIKPQ